MTVDVEDLAGLNRTRVRDLPIADSHETAEALLANAAGRQLSVAGLHHSQGGQTLLHDGRVLLTETMNRHIEVDPAHLTVEVDAGATWSQVHHALFRHGLCPVVHQSSAHFSVGGSISVNCHGRDPHTGPISTTVLSLTVLCGDGTVRQASAGENTDLFRAVVGGYGSCGLILRAKLRVMRDAWLKGQGRALRLGPLCDQLRSMAAAQADPAQASLFYAWLCCVPTLGGPAGPYFYDSVLAVDCTRSAAAAGPDVLVEQSWGISEMMRAAWAAARSDHGMRVRIWQELETAFIPQAKEPPGGVQRRINWMRSSVDFSSQRDDRSSDILVEYFLPVDGRLEDSIQALGQLALKFVNPLSTTVRLVRAEPEHTAPYLSYCAGRPMVCVAIDAAIGVQLTQNGRMPDDQARQWAQQSTELVLARGGSYYLPYFRFAGREVFRKAYPHWAAQQAAILKYNKDKRLWNSFLADYLDPDVA